MKSHLNKIIGEGLTYDDVLLVPNYSQVLPRDVSIKTKFSKNISIDLFYGLRDLKKFKYFFFGDS